MSYEISDVSRIEFDGPKRFEYVERDKHLYSIQREQWRYTHKLALPVWPILREFGRLRDLRILCGRVNIYIKFTNTYWMNWLFKPGFITDLASVPRALRGIVDNDEHQIIDATLVHDFCFATRRVPFHIANSIFYKVLRHNRYDRIRSLLAYWAVGSFVGRRCYSRSARKVERDAWSNERCDMQLARPIQYGGRDWF